jgi:hypothetical protein
MLVDDKFIIILIPRCATTSFVVSCQKYNIPTKSGMSNIGGYDKIRSLVTKQTTHYHKDLLFLTSKFGNDYPIIAVKRNKYDSFISLWKMILNVLSEHYNENELVEKLSKFKTEDILFFDRNEYTLMDGLNNQKYGNDIVKLSKIFFTKHNIPYNEILSDYLQLLYTPQIWYHNFDKRVIWFDFDKLNELEDWVSNKLNMDFKLENINSSKEIRCELKNDKYFKERFDYIYSKYETFKENKTLI